MGPPPPPPQFCTLHIMCLAPGGSIGGGAPDTEPGGGAPNCTGGGVGPSLPVAEERPFHCTTDRREGDLFAEKRGDGDFVGGVEHRRCGAPFL